MNWSHYQQPTLWLIVETVHSAPKPIDPSQPSSFPRHRSMIFVLRVVWDNNPPESLQPVTSTTHQRILSDPIHTPGVFLLDKINLSEVQDSFGTSRLGEASLKATSKDSMVAISYAIGFSAGSFNFDRIQFKFQNRADCSKFITILETIVPCKMKSGGTGNTFNNNSIRLENSQLEVGRSTGNSYELPLRESNDSQARLDPSQRLIETETDDQPVPKVQGHQGVLGEMVDGSLGHQPQDDCNPKTKTPPPPAPSGSVPLLGAEPKTFAIDGSLTSSSDRDLVIEQSRVDLNSLIDCSDQTLHDHVRQIISEPGFDRLVRRIKGILDQEGGGSD